MFLPLVYVARRLVVRLVTECTVYIRAMYLPSVSYEMMFPGQDASHDSRYKFGGNHPITVMYQHGTRDPTTGISCVHNSRRTVIHSPRLNNLTLIAAIFSGKNLKKKY